MRSQPTRTAAAGKARVPGTFLYRSKLRPGLRKPNSRLPGVQAGRPLGYLFSGVGLMCSSMQAMNMVGLHSRRSVMCQVAKSV